MNKDASAFPCIQKIAQLVRPILASTTLLD
jgi:hypothetical protein